MSPVHIGLGVEHVHGLTPAELAHAYILGNRVRWGYYIQHGHTLHQASITLDGKLLCAKGGTRHNALNILFGLVKQAYSQKDTSMAMSKDRVKFKLMAYMFSVENMSRTTELLWRAFGMETARIYAAQSTAREQGHTVIICRPSQFARFLIYREKAGFQNMFRELEATLFVPEAPKVVHEPIDVSGRAAQTPTPIVGPPLPTTYTGNPR